MILMSLAGYATSAAGVHDLPWFGFLQWPNVLPLDKDQEGTAAEIRSHSDTGATASTIPDPRVHSGHMS